MAKFIYDGVDSSVCGAYVTNAGVYKSAEPDLAEYEIAGKNGTLTIDNGRYKNVVIKYQGVIVSNFETNFSLLRNLLAKKGYKRLTDDFITDRFRMAKVTSVIDGTPTIQGDAGTFEINFDCKPQWFLLTGETAIEFTADGTITNPTAYDAKPLIRVYGGGTVTVGTSVFVVTAGTEYIDIDTDTMECYEEETNRNANVVATFGVLVSGENTVTLGGATKVIVTPRWFVI